MSKKIIFFCALTVIVLGVIFFYYQKTPVYGFVDEVKYDKNIISFRVFGAGNLKYGNYEIYEEEKGTYIFQMYNKVFFGSYYPKIIKIDNKDNRIKKLLQKTIDGTDFEVIYQSI